MSRLQLQPVQQGLIVVVCVAPELNIPDVIERSFLDDERDVSLALDADVMVEESPPVIEGSQLLDVLGDFLLGIIGGPENPVSGAGFYGFVKIAGLQGRVALERYRPDPNPRALNNRVDDFAFGELLSIQHDFRIGIPLASIEFGQRNPAGLGQNGIEIIALQKIQLFQQCLVFVLTIVLKFNGFDRSETAVHGVPLL